MKKLLLVSSLLLIGVLNSLFGFQVVIPDEILAYRPLVAMITLVEEEEPLSQARLYFEQVGKPTPAYSEFEKREGGWYALVPTSYLTGDEFIYYVQAQTEGGQFVRTPQIGTKRSRLIKDESVPTLKLVSPEEKELERGKEQLVVFEIIDESVIEDFSVSVDGETTQKAAVHRNLLSILLAPDTEPGSLTTVKISLTDRYGNTGTEEISFSITDQKRPFFSASTDYVANLSLAYAMRMGESDNTFMIKDVLSDMDHQVDLAYELGGEAKLGAGPLTLELRATLADDISVFDIPEAYPNSLIADYQNVRNLLHPWNFANEFDYSGEEPRKFYNSNKFLAKVSFFGPVFTYSFGDQQIHFQEQTVNNFGFRGSSLSVDVPFFRFNVGKGLSNLGLYQSAWPQNFFGFQIGFDVKDVWWLQTNMSFLSSLQGRYNILVDTGTSAIGTLYDLTAVSPDENMVMGFSTGVDHKFVNFSTDFGFTLYVDDASNIIDKDQLASDINAGFGIDLTQYMEYLDTISKYFPVLDYFPLTVGLGAKAVNKELWGITFGANLDFPSLGIDSWYRITDGTYKSLGAAVASDQLDWGGSWQQTFKGFGLSASYSWNKDNLPDILFTHILPVVKPDLAGTPPDPTANDISNIVQSASAGIETPFSPLLGSLTLDYTFTHESTNAEVLAAKISDDAAASAAIISSTSNDTTLTHTGELRYKSRKFTFGETSISLGAKTKDSYVTTEIVDGTQNGSTYWEFSYGVSPSIRFGRYTLNLNFDHEWSSLNGSETAYGYDAKLTISETFFDSINLKAGFDQQFLEETLQAYRLNGEASLDKRFGLLGVTAGLEGSLYNSRVDNADDSLKIAFNIKGSVTF